MHHVRFPTMQSAATDREATDARPPRQGLSLAQKSALLNLGIIVTALPVLSFAGNPKAAPAIFLILAAISLFIWVATFVAASFILLARIFLGQASRGAKPSHRAPAQAAGIPDEWLDSPF